jgi:hypothetical protein
MLKILIKRYLEGHQLKKDIKSNIIQKNEMIIL